MKHVMHRPAPIQTVHLYGLAIWQAGFAAAVERIMKRLAQAAGFPDIVVTPNIDHLVQLSNDRQLFSVYSKADLILPDGFPIVVSSRFLGTPIQERVTGADLFPVLCDKLARISGKIFVLGGPPGKEKWIVERLHEKYRGLNVRAYSPEYGTFNGTHEAQRAVDEINDWEPHAVFVCLGMPKQELWAFRYRDVLRTKALLCVGAAIDFELGTKRRAPRWIQRINMEWLWRLLSDPRRLWRRYLVHDIEFLRIFIQEWRAKKETLTGKVR